MTPNTITCGDALTVLRTWPDACVDCVVTSPPYWGLRDYGVAGQMGLEKTFAEWLAGMVELFTEVRRVLVPRGTAWVNMGDAYNAGTSAKRKAAKTAIDVGGWKDAEIDGGARVNAQWLKPKDLIGQPWRLAFALQDAGWYLRSDIIWHKPNPMPESVTDRPTKSHEYLFLLAKSERYHYDAAAIREPATDTGRENGRDGRDEPPGARPPGSNPRTLKRLDYTKPRKVKVPGGWDREPGAHGTIHRDGRTEASYQEIEIPGGRNKRSVWTIPPQACKSAHFATFPEALVSPCILAGCPADGIVCDPFMGAGTTALVAAKLGRRWCGTELNPAYIALAMDRLGLLALA